MGERAALQAQLEFSQKYSKGELEGMGSRELLEAPSHGMNSITGIVDNSAAHIVADHGASLKALRPLRGRAPPEP